MKIAIIFAFFFSTQVNISYSQEWEENFEELLITKVWKSGGVRAEIFYKFNKDGTFFSTYESEFVEAIDILGKWERISQDSFTMQTTQKVIKGKITDLNPMQYHKTVVHIKKINSGILKGVKHNILEDQESEFATEFEWKGVN